MTAGYQGKLLEEIEEKTEPKTKKFYIFEETEAQVLMIVNDIEVQRFSTYSDYYGPGTGVKEAIQEAKRQATYFKLTPQSDASIVVNLVTYKIKKHKTGRKMYFKPEEDEYETVSPGYIPKSDKTETIVWSSKPDIMAKAIAIHAITVLKTELETKGDVDLVNQVICPGCKKSIIKLSKLFDHFDCFVKAEGGESQ